MQGDCCRRRVGSRHPSSGPGCGSTRARRTARATRGGGGAAARDPQHVARGRSSWSNRCRAASVGEGLLNLRERGSAHGAGFWVGRSRRARAARALVPEPGRAERGASLGPASACFDAAFGPEGPRDSARQSDPSRDDARSRPIGRPRLGGRAGRPAWCAGCPVGFRPGSGGGTGRSTRLQWAGPSGSGVVRSTRSSGPASATRSAARWTWSPSVMSKRDGSGHPWDIFGAARRPPASVPGCPAGPRTRAAPGRSPSAEAGPAGRSP